MESALAVAEKVEAMVASAAYHPLAEKVEAMVASAGAADAEHVGDNQPPRRSMPGLDAAGREVADLVS